MAMMSAKEASSAWGISPRRITALCSAGKISGAKKANRIWQIPADAEKPVAARIRSGAYRKSAVSAPLPLPVGISDYRLASTEYYYVDKTLIMPQHLTPTWIKTLGADYEQIHEQWLHRIANLTLTAYNSKYSNSSFEEKKTMEHEAL